MIERGRHRDVVYFARDVSTGRVKIGTTIDLFARVRALRKEVGGAVEVLATISGTRRLEGQFQLFLVEHHVGHEWFAPHPRIEAVAMGVKEGWFSIACLPQGPSPVRREASLRGWRTRGARAAEQRRLSKTAEAA